MLDNAAFLLPEGGVRPFLGFDVIVSMDRNAASTAVVSALGETGGWIVGHALFSDVMVAIRFSLPGNRVGDFGRALAEAGLTLDPQAVDRRDASDEEISGQITPTLPRGAGDMRRAVPAF